MPSVVLSILLALFPAGCTKAGLSRTVELAQLSRHRQQWDHRAFRNYEFAYSEHKGRMRGGPFYITVHDRTVLHVITEFGDVGDSTSAVPTIDALFDSARTSLEYGRAVIICYDTRLGYPTEFATSEVEDGLSATFAGTVSWLRPLP